MFHKLRKFYYTNKTQILRIVFIVISIFIIIQLANYFVKLKNNNIMNNSNNNISATNTIINNNTNTFITSNTSATTGEQINPTNLEKARKIIEKFISACNNGNVEEAYSYLSNDCKQELYTEDINQFKTLYYDVIFGGNQKNASVENWILNTYKIDITEDIMATGNANGIKTQDYMTVVEENDDIKLNINNFVGTEQINKEQTIEDIKISIINKKTYIDYEEYELKVENETGNRILLDSLQNTKSIYLQDDNETEYYSYSNEILSELLKINNGFSTKLTIKFHKSYSLNNKTQEIVFSDVTLNYNDNINEDSERKTIKIDV